MKSPLTPRAKSLRAETTDAERLLWRHLRGHRFEGRKFKRQEPLGAYIVDFVCHDARLIIEIDGGQHVEQAAYDEKRTAFLAAQGYRVIRFWNNEVLGQTDDVLAE